MPYIHKDDRAYLDSGGSPADAGELNYTITKIVDQYIEEHGLRYKILNEVVGALECAKMELYRRVAAPYEDTKIDTNGDVYTC